MGAAAVQALAFAIRAQNEASKALREAANDIEGVEKAAHKAGTAMAEAEGHGSKFGGALSNVTQIASGFVLGQGIMKAPGFLMDAAKAAMEDEKATARLQQTIKSLGGDFDSQMDAVNGAIEAGQKLAFTDDDVRDSFEFLAQATGDTDEALKRQRIAMDLARGANIPLATATKMLGKLTDENINVFKKMGITMEKGMDDAEVMARIQEKFGGQADAYAKSTAGQFEQAQIAIDEAKESIGAALLPVMALLGTKLAEMLPVVQAFIGEWSANLAPAVAKVGEVVGEVVDRLGGSEEVLKVFAAVAIPLLVAGFVAWAVSATSAAIATIAAAAPVIAVVAAIALLSAGIFLLIEHWDEIVAKYPAVGEAFDNIKAAVEGVIDYVTEHWDEIQTVMEATLTAVVAMVKLQFEQIANAIDAALKIISGYIDIWIGLFTGDWDRVMDGVKEIVSGAWQLIKGTFQNAFDFIDTLTDGKLSAVTSTVTEKLSTIGDKFTTAWDSIKETVGGAMDSLISLVSGPLDTIAENIRSWYETAVAPVQWLIDRFWQLIDVIRSIPTPSIPSIGDLNPFASGTSFAPGGLAIVNEKGPEIIDLPRGARVHTARESAKMGGGVHVSVTGPITIANGQDASAFFGDLGFAISRRLRAGGR